MLQALQQTYDFLFGCRHRRLSRPFTLLGKTYEVCLTCGKKFSYSLETMSLIKVRRLHRHRGSAPIAQEPALSGDSSAFAPQKPSSLAIRVPDPL